MSYAFDPEFAQAVQLFAQQFGMPPAKPAVGDVKTRREGVSRLSAMLNMLPPVSDVEENVYQTKAADGHIIEIYGYTKKGLNSSSPGPAVCHFHGGGMIVGDAKTFGVAMKMDVSATGVPHYSVDYRLAPEAPFPIPVEDCYAGLVWLSEHAAELNIDPERIAIRGESAGGGLAADVALLARDRGLQPPIAKQILVYPMLDDRTLSAPEDLEPFLIAWGVDDNITGWNAFLENKAGAEDTSQYAAAARAKSVKGLPPTYIDCGTLDLFHAENKSFVERLRGEGIPVEWHEYEGVPHGFELVAPQISMVKTAVGNRMKAITNI